MNEKEENWKVIKVKGIKDYECSNLGRFRKIQSKRIIKGHRRKDGYVMMSLNKVKEYAHRLLLQTFKPNRKWRKLTVNHKNKIKHSNFVDNLEWCTMSENLLHSYQTGRHNIPKQLKVLEEKYIKLVISKIEKRKLAVNIEKMSEYFGLTQNRIARLIVMSNLERRDRNNFYKKAA